MGKPGRKGVNANTELVEGNNAKQVSRGIIQALNRAFLKEMLRYDGTYFC
jgi:hypothetical protein